MPLQQCAEVGCARGAHFEECRAGPRNPKPFPDTRDPPEWKAALQSRGMPRGHYQRNPQRALVADCCCAGIPHPNWQQGGSAPAAEWRRVVHVGKSMLQLRITILNSGRVTILSLGRITILNLGRITILAFRADYNFEP